MDSEVAKIVEGITTAILQWRITWLNEQKLHAKPPPICRMNPRQLKITFDNTKDYESTFFPLLMHEIWAQIFEEWVKLETELSGVAPMDVDVSEHSGTKGTNSILSASSLMSNHHYRRVPVGQAECKLFNVGVLDYRSDGMVRTILRCQYIIDSNKVASHLKIVGEGDLVRIDLLIMGDFNQARTVPQEYLVDVENNMTILSLFAYVGDVSSERVHKYTSLAECYGQVHSSLRNHHIITYTLMIAKRPLRLRMDQPIKMYRLYYLKPMIRQIEAVATLRESPLANDILSPKAITCKLTIPTVISMKSPDYNDMQYKAIIGANEAMVRSIPKIQLIQGPPGTGKTHTLIGIIKHFYMNLKHDIKTIPKILICAPSNGAIDEVVKRIYKERDFTKKGSMKRSLRLVRIGHPDQISESVKCISLEELVEANAHVKVESHRKKHSIQMQQIEDELNRCDMDIANLRYSNKSDQIPELEHKVARLVKELEAKKASEETSIRREFSEAAKRNIRYDLIKNADIILATLNSCQRQPLDALFRGDRAELSFDCVIVDEASQCCEPELLMPLCYKITRMILIGDPMQLPATVISRFAQEFDYGRSLFERFFIHFGQYNSCSPIVMLTEQYRMHPEICQFPSKQFYDGRLVSATQVNRNYPLKPYVLLDLRHGNESRSHGSSKENEVEANLVRTLLLAVLIKAPENSQVGVITPYKGQKRLITSKIASMQSQRCIKVDVNTCDGFQGQEKDIIILSCVRSFESGSIGFLKSHQRVNVALTRARHCLIICMSGKSLTKDKTWQALMDDADERRCVISLTHTPSAGALGNMIVCNNMGYTNNPSTNRVNPIMLPELIDMDID